MTNQDLVNKRNQAVELIKMKDKLFSVNEDFIKSINELEPEKITENDELYRELKTTENSNLEIEIEALGQYVDELNNALIIESQPEEIMSPKDQPDYYPA